MRIRAGICMNPFMRVLFLRETSSTRRRPNRRNRVPGAHSPSLYVVIVMKKRQTEVEGVS
jgi:hypothetical protein